MVLAPTWRSARRSWRGTGSGSSAELGAIWGQQRPTLAIHW